MLPAIILICDVFCVSLLEQETTRKGRVYEKYEMYEMYKMYEMYEMDKMYKRYETDGRYPSQYGFHNEARSRQLAGDLSPWCKERQGACIGSSTIGSSTSLKTEQHLIPISLSSDTQSLL